MQHTIEFTQDEIRILFYGYAQPQGSVKITDKKDNNRKKKTHAYYEKKNYIFRNELRAVFNKYNFDRPYFKRGVPVIMRLNIHRSMPKSYGKKKREQAKKGHIMPVTRPDNSNCLKQIEDALNGIAYWDDAQICQHIMCKGYEDVEKIEIIIKRIEVDDR